MLRDRLPPFQETYQDRYLEVAAPNPRRRPGGPETWAAHGLAESVRIRVRYLAEGKGSPVVLAHGLGASLAVWDENIQALAARHAVYAVDLPGYGKSDKPEGLAYDAVAGAHFLARFMDGLSLPSAALVGNSAGGLITAIFATLYADRVDRLVLVGPAGLGRPVAWFLRLASLPLLGELLHIPSVRNPENLIRSVFYRPRPLRPELLNELAWGRNLPDAKRANLRALRSAVGVRGMRRQMMVLHKLQEYRRPLLVLWGREDRIIPASHARDLTVALPNAAVHVIPECGHWPQLEKPEAFNPLVLKFLDDDQAQLGQPGQTVFPT